MKHDSSYPESVSETHWSILFFLPEVHSLAIIIVTKYARIATLTAKDPFGVVYLFLDKWGLTARDEASVVWLQYGMLGNPMGIKWSGITVLIPSGE